MRFPISLPILLAGLTSVRSSLVIPTSDGNFSDQGTFRFASLNLAEVASNILEELETNDKILRFESAGSDYDLVDINQPLKAGHQNPCFPSLRHECKSGILCAFYTAYAHGLPLQLAPEHFWILITRSVSHHIHSPHNQIKAEFRSGDREWNGEWWPIWVGFLRDSQRAETELFHSLQQIIQRPFSSTQKNSGLPIQLALKKREEHEWSMKKKNITEATSNCCTIPRIILLGSRENYADLAARVGKLIKLLPSLGWYLKRVQLIVDVGLKEFSIKIILREPRWHHE